jgi:2-dehydropantoate 2-reductase
MKIAVVGVGAMGSVYAGLLADAGNEVWAVDTWEEHVAAIRERGLRVEGASGERTVRLDATTDASEVGPVDLVVIATKAQHVEAAAASARPLLGPETVVVSIQNGLGGPDRAAEMLGDERVAIGVVGGFGASIVEPGHVHHNGWELVRLGERNGPVTPRIEQIAEVWRDAGFKVQTYDDVGTLVWEKLVCNTAFSGTCALLELTVGEVLESDDAFSVAGGCAAETFAVAKASGIELGFADPVEYVREFGSKIPNARPSMLLDLMARRSCEIDVINGAVPPAARAVGLEAPVNATVTALVKAKEARIVSSAGQG